MSIHKRQHQHLSMFVPPLNVIYDFKSHKRKPQANLSWFTSLLLVKPWNLCSRVRWLHSTRTIAVFIMFCVCALYSQLPRYSQQQVITEVITGSKQCPSPTSCPHHLFFSPPTPKVTPDPSWRRRWLQVSPPVECCCQVILIYEQLSCWCI